MNNDIKFLIDKTINEFFKNSCLCNKRLITENDEYSEDGGITWKHTKCKKYIPINEFDYMGVINHDLVQGVKVDNCHSLPHNKCGVIGRKRWKYDGTKNVVIWSIEFDKHDVDMVNQWLNKVFGVIPSKHYSYTEYYLKYPFKENVAGLPPSGEEKYNKQEPGGTMAAVNLEGKSKKRKLPTEINNLVQTIVNETIQKCLIEGQNQDNAKNILTKSNSLDVYPYLEKMDITPTKKHLPKLAEYFVEIKDLNILNDYYKRFCNSRLKLKDIYEFKTFRDFENAIDAVDVDLEDSNSIEVSGKPIYEDNKINIFKGNSQKACIQYGNGYGFCISNKNLSSNLFHNYRFKNEATAYFIRFKDKSSEIKDGKFIDPLHLIVLHVYNNGIIMITGADNGKQGNGTENITKEELLNKFPELIPAWKKGIFSVDKYSEIEKDIINNIHDKYISNEQFSNFNGRLKMAYITFNKELSDKMWNNCNDEHKLKYIEIGSYDLTDYQKTTCNEKLLKRYWEKIKQRTDIKLNNEVKLTHDEIKYCFKYYTNIVIEKNLNYNDNELTTLQGCPQTIGGGFNCGGNKLTTLQGCPQTINGDFYCNDNKLTTLQGCPKTVGGNFYCYNTKKFTERDIRAVCNVKGKVYV